MESAFCYEACNVCMPQEGVSPKEMDKKTKAMGFPIGSATLIDEVGIDIGAHVADYISAMFGPRFGFGSNETSLLKDLVAQGYLGMLYMVFDVCLGHCEHDLTMLLSVVLKSYSEIPLVLSPLVLTLIWLKKGCHPVDVFSTGGW